MVGNFRTTANYSKTAEYMDNQSPVRKCLHAILKPVIRYCLRHSIKLQDFVEIAKALYVESANDELQREGSEISISRLSIMTGVHRKDVPRLQSNERTEQPFGADLSARVLGHWQTSRRFLTKNGKPKVLQIEGAESEFSALVQSVSREMNPYTVLFELERAGMVDRTTHGLRLKARSFITADNLDEGLHFLQTDSEDLIQAVEENLFSQQQIRNLHIKTEYDNIGETDLDSIRSWLLAQGEAFHAKARRFLATFDRDVNPKISKRKEPSRRVRIALGTFSRAERI